MKAYITRHGQTEWNKLERWQGNKDIPLDVTGIAQSKQVSKKLANCNISRIYSSPQIRTAETARIIQKTIQSEIVFCNDLREIRMGDWEGLSLIEMEDIYGDLYREWYTNEMAQIDHGVENYYDLQKRAFYALNEICSNENDSVLLVTHGTWLRALICKLLCIPFDCRYSFEISNTGVSILDYDKDSQVFKVLSLNALL